MHDHATPKHHDHAAHAHDHHHGHAHAPRSERHLLWAFVLTTITLVVEAVGGWISGSLALLADAAHMFVDAAALLFAWLGARFARRPADARRSFGYARLEVLVGYTNALTQVFLVAWILFEAVTRFLAPAPILSGTMLVVAIAGLVVNLVVLRVLGGHDHDDVNTAGARLHVLGDLLGSLGAVVAALLVRWLDWLWADPLISVFVALLILNAAMRLLRRCAHILLEGVPDGVEVERVSAIVEGEAEGVRDIHHVHIWQLSGGQRIATLHACLREGVAPDHAIRSIQQVLRLHFGIAHATVQVEDLTCAQADCGHAAGR
ncbi:MAG TPA: cation diffusion facilitator family transporter [Dokdonella sp.]|uniref:cation diffusion facilitator family transporter n=1 Tax=Dokdonella sp. TaxID=2291710 RepID=UPI0025BD0025|nr:cation diffusion facilitator family transporter [Dokdonella sp.]MBX3693132.1 cation transporter [Dokdonella sp.]MCW5568250.1 cation transporter [Dokdonella sp.]HNR91759.1 cation diffusion facilitator family transporter [Dokdonella sp.]